MSRSSSLFCNNCILMVAIVFVFIINKAECGLTILGASYGLTDETATISNNVVANELSLTCSNGVLGDGWPGKVKVCTVVYSYDFNSNAAAGSVFHSYVATCKEGETLTINSGSDWTKYTNIMPQSNELEIVGATYGSGTKYLGDVTGLVSTYATSSSLNIDATNSNFGDRWPGYHKALTVVYIDGSTKNSETDIVMENVNLNIQI